MPNPTSPRASRVWSQPPLRQASIQRDCTSTSPTLRHVADQLRPSTTGGLTFPPELDPAGMRELPSEQKAMSMRQRHTAEQNVGLLRQAEAELAHDRSVGEICPGLRISEASYDRWRSEYGGLKVDQARRLKELERENARLK